MLSRTASYLDACAEAGPTSDVAGLASKHGLSAALLKTWLDYLEIGEPGAIEVRGHYTEKMLRSVNHDFVNGWGSSATPSFAANSSDREVRIPGIARPRPVFAHPSSTLFSAAGWPSPISGVVRIEARIADAHPECGNGVEWFVRHRCGKRAGKLRQGEFGRGGSATMLPGTVSVRRGDLVSFLLGPRQGNHACDLTEIQLTISETGGA